MFHDGVEYLASTPLAETISKAGWVSPEEHETLAKRLRIAAGEWGKASSKVARQRRILAAAEAATKKPDATVRDVANVMRAAWREAREEETP